MMQVRARIITMQTMQVVRAVRSPFAARSLFVSCSFAGATHPNLTLSLELQRIAPELVSAAGQSFPGLTGLSVRTPSEHQGSVKLPPPTHLPALRHLTVRRVAKDTQQRFWASVGPYMPQLQSLVVQQQPFGEDPKWRAGRHAAYLRHDPWAAVLTPRHTTHTLTHLTVPSGLDSWMVKLLKRHAPGLQELAVRCLAEDANVSVSERVCSWTVMRLWILPLRAVTWLPVPATGKLLVDTRSSREDYAGPLRMDVALPLSSKVRGSSKHAIAHCLSMCRKAYPI